MRRRVERTESSFTSETNHVRLRGENAEAVGLPPERTQQSNCAHCATLGARRAGSFKFPPTRCIRARETCPTNRSGAEVSGHAPRHCPGSCNLAHRFGLFSLRDHTHRTNWNICRNCCRAEFVDRPKSSENWTGSLSQALRQYYVDSDGSLCDTFSMPTAQRSRSMDCRLYIHQPAPGINSSRPVANR